MIVCNFVQFFADVEQLSLLLLVDSRYVQQPGLIY